MSRSVIVARVITVALLAAIPLWPRPASSSQRLAAFGADADSFAAGMNLSSLSTFALPVDAFWTRTRAHIDSQPRAQGFAGILDVPLVELFSSQKGPLGLQAPASPPNYCYANFPGSPSCAIDLNGPAGAITQPAGTGGAQAKGDAADPESTAAQSAVQNGATNTQQLNVGSADSTSSTRVVNGVAEATTTVRLQRVEIAGVLKIGSLVASATSRAGGEPRSASTDTTFDVGNASVAGTAIAFTREGLSVGGRPVPSPGTSQLDPVAKALQQAGITVEPTPAPVASANPDGTEARASTLGLRIDLRDPSGNELVLRLGNASTSATANLAVPVEGAAPTGSGPAPGGTDAVVGAAGLAAEAGGPLGNAAVVAPPLGGAPSSRAVAGAVPAAARDRLVGRFRSIYLAMLVGSLVVGTTGLARRRPRFRFGQ